MPSRVPTWHWPHQMANNPMLAANRSKPKPTDADADAGGKAIDADAALGADAVADAEDVQA